MPTIEEFYGEASKRIVNREKAEAAIRQFGLALNASSENVEQRALDMAARNETAAFTVS
jgi:hypothetical protein